MVLGDERDGAVSSLELVRQAVATICRVPLEGLAANTRPADVRGWDSFGRLQVIMELERLLDRELPLKRAFDAETLGEIAEILDQVPS